MRLVRLLPAVFALVVIVLISSPARAFTVISNAGKPSYWANGNVGYYFHSSVDAGIQDPFRQAFASWQAVAGVNLVIQELGALGAGANSDDGLNTIVWVTAAWRDLDFRPPSNALAVTLLSFNSGEGTISDADIYFNSQNFQWGVVAPEGGGALIDIQNIATHEIGHLLGLDHSSEEFFEPEEVLSDATMYYASGAGEVTRRVLKEDDIYGLRSLYGTSPGAAPTIGAVSEISRNDDDLAEFQVTGENFNELTSFILTKGSSLSSDRIARYRTIVSPNEARITLDLDGFPNGSAALVAFNNPANLSSFSMSVSASAISATSSGGGGCSLQVQKQHPFSWVTFYFVMLSSLSLLLARRRFRRTRSEAQPEEGL